MTITVIAFFSEATLQSSFYIFRADLIAAGSNFQWETFGQTGRQPASIFKRVHLCQYEAIN